MLNRLIIHIKNLWISLRWIILNFNNFKDELEGKGYYAVSFYKIFLWKKDARYFRAFNDKGECFFIKMKNKEKTLCESRAIDYINNKNLEKLGFFPKIYNTITNGYSYNIFEDLEGEKINKNLILEFNLITQMVLIISFFQEIKLVHRDIRPHNLIVQDGILKVLDFEHCSIPSQSHYNYKDLNKKFRPKDGKWDDAYSFKKILDLYVKDNKSKSEYVKLSNMVDTHVYYKSN